MKTNKILIGAVAILVVLNVTLIGFIFCKPCHKGPRKDCKKGQCEAPHDFRKGEGFHYFLKNELGFTEEQMETADKLHKETMAFKKAQHQKMKVLNKAYFDCVCTSCAEKDSLFQAIAQTHEATIKHRYEHLEQLIKLTPADKQETLEKMFMRMQHRGSEKGKH